MMPGAVAIGVTMPVAGRLSDRYASRSLVVAGVVLTSFSLFLYGALDPRSSAMVVIGPQLIRGVGLALMMAPLMKAASTPCQRRR